MVATGVRRLILKPRRPSTGINSLRDLGIAFLKIYYTQTIVSYTSHLLVVHELAVSARTCTQRPSELATVSVGCVELPELIYGRRRCVWDSWHLQTVQTSGHCDLWRCTANHSALSKLSCNMCKCIRALPGTYSCQNTGPESPPCFCALH